MNIVRPITDDGLVGFNESGVLVHCRKDGEWSTFVGIHDVRRLTCIVCDHGWQETGPSMGDQTFWELTKSHVHLTCLIRHEGLCERSEFWHALVLARVRFSGLATIPNGYWGGTDPWAKKPWYETELLDYPVKIVLGARKRVLVVDFRAQGGTELGWSEQAKEMLKGEDVTKEFSSRQVMLHAWGTEKMKSYVKQICVLAGYDKELGTKT